MKKLLIVVDSPGSADFIAPVFPLLQKKFKTFLVTVNIGLYGPYTILKNLKPLRCDHEKDALRLYDKIRPDTLLVGTSSLILGPYVNNKFIHLANADGKKIVAFQDYWANHRWPQNKETLYLWNTILTLDILGEKLLREDNFKGNIVVTGNPAFDKFSGIDIEKEKIKLRKKLNIPLDAFIILYAGSGTPQSWTEDETTFRFLALTLQEFTLSNPNVIVIPRKHPRDEESNRYQKLVSRFPIYNPDHGNKKYSTDSLLPIADCVVGMYSSVLLHACFLKIPAVSILLPEAGRARLRKIGLDNFPPNTVGAAVGVYKDSTRELMGVLNSIKNDPGYREKILRAQTQFFPFNKNKKTATETVAGFLRK